jgi:alpha-L-fucosidase
VPAWAEPTGALGAVPDEEWFAHNPYAEWYANTIRIPGSPAAEHHRDTYRDAPYDDFLDAWTAERFDPVAWAELFAAAGASYVVPTTKHHDGIALWDAPATGSRNTVHRGPRRDLIGPRSPTRSGQRDCGSASTTPVGWTGTSPTTHRCSRAGTYARCDRETRPTTRTPCCTSGT